MVMVINTITRLLERMLGSQALVHCKELSLSMYNFYTREKRDHDREYQPETESDLDR